jgi:DNA-binding transcriptional MerR regulator
MTETEPRLRIGELSRRTGVRSETLRAWERRYGLLEPSRSEGGFRLYGSSDEQRVRTMRALIDSGAAPAEAARMVLAGTGTQLAPAAEMDGELGVRLREALERFDETEANAILDRAVAALSTDTVLRGVVLPVLVEIGNRWQRGEMTVGQEHFATNVLRGRLAALARNWGGGGGPLAILACPPGEQHDIGLLAFGLALRSRGWRISYLGADTPIETLVETAGRLRPRAIVLAALTKERMDDAAAAIAEAEFGGVIWFAGAGASHESAESANARLLTQDPIAAAEQLAAR